MDDLRSCIINYRDEPIINEKLNIVARKSGRVAFDGYYKTIMTIESNYSRINIDWPKGGVIPGEFWDPSKYPIKFKYYEDEDILHIDGDYNGKEIRIVVKLPPKRNN